MMKKRVKVIKYINRFLMVISILLALQSSDLEGEIGLYFFAIILGIFQVLGALVTLPLLKNLHETVKGVLGMYLGLVFFYFIIFIGMNFSGANENHQLFLECFAGFLAVLITIVFELLHLEKKEELSSSSH